ncbi:amino acid adenylation domain-containing protein [Dactylosporangium sp. NPDC005555]|uniref:amino acid adenylation domain-containing protein n=1 Tax=Dactylosporangium sp. NPDC005555 TaxID=3154889 RepID=UPI0033B70CFD
MSRSNVEEVLPLAPLQEGLLFHAMLGADAYLVQTSLDLTGPLDVARLRAAADALVARHANLRAAFVADAAGAVQVVLRTVTVPWRVIDGDLDGDLDRALEADRATPFAMDEPPLLRFLLARTGPDTHRLVMTSHHILLDGWSAPLLLRDLFALYAGTPLPRVTPFRDFLAWLRRRDPAASRAAWAQALDGLTAPTLVAPAPRGDTLAAGPVTTGRVDLDDAVATGIAGLARRHGVTTGTVVQAAWGVTLGALTGADDVVFGLTVSGRPADLPGVDGMVGLFINTVPVRVRIRPGDSVGGLLRALHAAQAGTVEHHHLGLGEIQAAAGLGDLFDTLVVVESYPVDDDAIDRVRAAMDLRVSGVDTTDTTHYPLALVVEPGPRVGLFLEVRPDRVTPAAAETVRRRLRRVLAAFVAAPDDLPIGRIDLLDPTELDPAAPPVPATHQGRTAVDLLAEQVATAPDAVAVVDARGSLTFAELDARADRLAAHLAGLGVGPEVPVALLLPRSASVPLAMAAVWKAGGVVVPVDPTYPAERIAAVLEQARPAVVITETGAPDGTVAAADPASWTGTATPRGPAAPDTAAYIVFTSGSSGRPKGVVATHTGLVNLALAHRRAVMEPASARLGGRRLRVLNSLSFAFDGSVDPLVWMLGGHTMHVLPDDLMGDPAAMVAHIDAHRIDFIDVPPSLLELLVADGLLTLPHPPSVIATGAEAVGGPLWDRLASAEGVHALNFYGPTECTVDALWTPIEAGVGAHIGRPVAGLAAYVLDAALRPVATGVPGELYVAGAGVARGYLGRAAETATRFVADPSGGGDRLYRTGDLARRTAAGTIEFLGRADDQVKIRGHRVEPAEIEAVLGALRGVAQAVVVARRDGAATRLVGYVTGSGVTGAELRERLAARLPDHLVPAAIVVLPALPTLPNGKLDRRGLPAPDFAGTSTRQPATAEEKAVCAIFADLLGVPDAGVDDSFFALGGHSLLAARLVARIRAELGAALPVRAVFRTPTPAGIAAALSGESVPDGAFDELLRLRDTGAAAPLFCLPPALGLSWSYAALVGHQHPQRPVYGLQATATGSGVTFAGLVERYTAAITAAAPNGPVLLLGWSLGAVLAHAVGCALHRQGREVPVIVLLDGYPGPADDASPVPGAVALSRFLHVWLRRAGYDTGGLDPDTVTAGDVHRIAARHGGVLAGLTADRIDALATSMLAASTVDSSGTPDVFGGDVVFVQARPDDGTTGPDPRTWAPYVAGSLTVHPVPFGHEDLLSPPAVRVIGPISAAAFAAGPEKDAERHT